jgi:hypothetical protein
MVNSEERRVYVKEALLWSIPAGLIIGSFYAFAFHNASIGIVAGIALGLMSGMGSKLAGGAVHRLAMKDLKADQVESLLGMHQVQVITVRQSFEDAFEACQNALQDLRKCRITLKDKENGIIRAHVSVPWTWPGERILVVISPEADGTCKVTVSSKTATARFDYGINIENIRLFVDGLSKRVRILEAGPDSSHLIAMD